MEFNPKSAEYIHDPNAPIVHADWLHDVELIGDNCQFNMVTFQRNGAGVWVKETAWYARIPAYAVGPAIALTLSKLGSAIVIPAAQAVVREIVQGFRLH